MDLLELNVQKSIWEPLRLPFPLLLHESIFYFIVMETCMAREGFIGVSAVHYFILMLFQW